MNVFNLRDQLVTDYSEYVRSYIQIRDERISKHVSQRLDEGMLWPEPLIQLNPFFEPGAWIDELVQEGILHAECANIFRKVVDHVLRRGSGKGIQAIIVYPMNALANSQNGELTKFLCHG